MTTETLPSMALPAGQSPTMPTTTAEATPSFADLGLDPRAVATLTRMGIETPTLIQARAIPPLLAGRDVVGQSRTGSGKTVAYGAPLVERMDPRLRRLQALVLVPTRELAGQVAGVLMMLGANRGLRVAQLIGGRSYLPQREALRMGAQIAVGAPGRVLDHLRQGTLDLSHLTIAVLDEADQMLDAGFAPDVERLLAAMPAERQLALFTATLPEMTTQIARRHLHDPISVDAGSPESRPAPTVTQIAYAVPREHRLNALMALLDRRRHASGTTLVFGRTKHGVDKLARQLIARGYPVAALHGNMSQNARDRVLADFRSGKSPMLLATNVAARGLDVLSIEQVINYELPESADLFTHRVGRTGRMDNTGEAITLLTPDDMAAWRRFQRDLSLKMKPMPWPLEDMPINSAPVNSAPVNNAPGAMTAQPDASTVTPDAAPDASAYMEPERASERRAPRPATRFEDRDGERRFERRPTRRFERDGQRDGQRGFGQGAVEGERRPARRSFATDARPASRDVNRDVVARWSRPAADEDRRADYRERRDDRREDRREDDPRASERREQRPDGRFAGASDDRRDDRRPDRRGPARDDARRPASPRRAPYRTGADRTDRTGQPGGRPARARNARPSRG